MKKIVAFICAALVTCSVYAGLETGTYINSLVITNPTGSDPFNTTDDHIRLLKSTIKSTFPNLTGAVTSDQGELNKLDGVTTTATQFNYLNAASGTTGTGSVVFSTAPTFTGTVTGGTFSGSGASLTSLNASNLSSGTVASGRLSGSYSIDISGNAATATSATSATTATAARNITGKAGTAGTLSTSAPSGGSDGDVWYQY